MKSKLLEIIFQLINYTVFIIFCILCIYPFYYIFIYSISDPIQAQSRGIVLLPVSFTLNNYINILKLQNVGQAAMISALRTLFGTMLTVFFSSMLAYVFTKNEMVFRKLFYRLTAISLYLSAGLIPYYMTMRLYGLKNSFLLYILPGAIAPFFVILVKTYIEQLPDSIQESAIIDGAGFFTIFLKIIIPLSLPVLAAVAVFSAVNQWNSWYDNFLLVSNEKLQTLQLLLLNYLREADSISKQSNIDVNQAKNLRLTPTSVRMTITMVAVIPIICVYPYLQKYFVKGIMLGAVKG